MADENETGEWWEALFQEYRDAVAGMNEAWQEVMTTKPLTKDEVMKIVLGGMMSITPRDMERDGASHQAKQGLNEAVERFRKAANGLADGVKKKGKEWGQ